MTAALCLIAALVASTEVTEPHTGTDFDTWLDVDGVELVLTGVDHRRVMGRDAYAVAHYATAKLAQAGEGLSPDERLTHYRNAPSGKAIVFRGVYRKVPARGIRWSWKQHFERLDVPPHEEFIAAFDAPFRRGERLYFLATEDDRLTVYHDAEQLGTWEDAALVRAFWDMCLGPATEVETPRNLVTRDVPDAALAKRSGATEGEDEATEERAP